MEKYVRLAKELNMLNARLISPEEIVFDHPCHFEMPMGM